VTQNKDGFHESFSEALADEVAADSVTVSCLCPGPTATEFADTAKMGDALMFKLQTMTAQQVARAGYRGFRRGKPLVVPGWMNYLGSMGVRFVPRSMARRIAKRLQWNE
jgi:short-subunit dehydrogenase